jgi:hypothetical protein
MIDKTKIREVLGQTLIHAHFRKAFDELGERIAALPGLSPAITPLVGPMGSGRSRLVSEVKAGFGRNRAGQLPDRSRLDIVVARAPTSANAAALVTALLTGLGHNATGRQSVHTLRARLTAAVAHGPIRLFVLDDFNQCVERCSRSELLHVAENLADLAKTFEFSVLLSLTPRAYAVVRDRLGHPRGWTNAVELQVYDWNKDGDRREFARSVKTLVVALEQVGFTFGFETVPLLRRLYGLSAGVVGEVVEFLAEAAQRADKTGRVDLAVMRAAAQVRYSDRTLSADFLADDPPPDLALIRRHVGLLAANGIEPTLRGVAA